MKSFGIRKIKIKMTNISNFDYFGFIQKIGDMQMYIYVDSISEHNVQSEGTKKKYMTVCSHTLWCKTFLHNLKKFCQKAAKRRTEHKHEKKAGPLLSCHTAPQLECPTRSRGKNKALIPSYVFFFKLTNIQIRRRSVIQAKLKKQKQHVGK